MNTNNTVHKKASHKKSIKLSGSDQVIQYLSNLDHPLKNEIEEVRTIILGVDENISEHIKWNAPSFCYNNEDRVTFNLYGKDFLRLVFHRGAKSKTTRETVHYSKTLLAY